MIRRLLERLLLGPKPTVPAIGDRRSTIRWVPVTSGRLQHYIGHPVALGPQAGTLSRVDRYSGAGAAVAVVIQYANGDLKRYTFPADVELPVCVDIDRDDVR